MNSANLCSGVGRVHPSMLGGCQRTGATNFDGVPDGYRAMNKRESIKVMIKF